VYIIRELTNKKNASQERLSFEKDQKCKIYVKYPLLAIKYSEKHKKSKKLQLEFRDRDTFDNCISYFDLWCVPKKILDCDQLDTTSCSQFTQASQQSVNQFSFSQPNTQPEESSQARIPEPEIAAMPAISKALKRNSVTWSQNLLGREEPVSYTEPIETPDYGNPMVLSKILEQKLQDPNFIDLVSFQ